MTQIVIGQGKSEMGTPDIIKGEILRNGVDAAPLRRPSHVGVIMDGNGRWAASHGLPRFEGHRRGVEALRQTVRAAIDFGLDYLTVYSFSVENWTRPVEEISDLMGLLKRFIQNDLHELQRAGVKIKVIGIRETLKPDIRNLLEQAETLTKSNTKLNLLIAFNYGSRQEIVAAARAIAEKVASGQLKPENIDESLFVQYLDTAGVPDPDLIIRTSGEQRLSNFLMWQAAYAEFVFLPIYWPDFDRKAFESALDQYAVRERRFGGVAEHVAKAAIGS